MLGKVRASADNLFSTMARKSKFNGIINMEAMVRTWPVGKTKLLGDRLNPFTLIESHRDYSVFEGTYIVFETQTHPEIEKIKVLSGTMKAHQNPSFPYKLRVTLLCDR